MKIVVILGPTGVGKTEVSINLAKKMNASIINADKMQIYKEANIGTAKITKEEMCNIPHYLISTVSLKDEYTVKDYQTDARKILNELIEKDKNVIITGGSGLYIKSLLYDYKFTLEDEKKEYTGISNEELKRRVDEIYKENDIHVNNRKRLTRFLSHYETTGKIIKNDEGKDKKLYDFILIGLTTDKSTLYEHLNKRVEIMICDGLIEEARNLYNNGFTKAENIIGYKEFYEYFKGNMSITETVDSIKRNTRKYAKRQYTWINNQFEDVKWFNVDYNNIKNTIEKIEDYLNSF